MCTRIVKTLSFLILLLAGMNAHALTFDFIYPEGEGDTESAMPFLDAFYNYVKTKTGLELSGLYINDADEAELEFAEGKVDTAVVAPEFYESKKDELKLSALLKTIPIHASGPYEKYYILAGENMIPATYAGLRTPVALYASRSYTNEFIEALAKGSAEIRNVPFRLTRTESIITAIRNIAERKDTGFLLLTGYEYSVVAALKEKNPTFTGLKLIYTSPEFPSSPLVVVGDRVKAADAQKLKTALLGMAHDPAGKKILADLRLKGFTL